MGLTEQGKVVVGIPMVTSVANLQFWLQLCNAASLPEAASTVQRFRAQARDKDRLAQDFQEYNRTLVKQVNAQQARRLTVTPMDEWPPLAWPCYRDHSQLCVLKTIFNDSA